MSSPAPLTSDELFGYYQGLGLKGGEKLVVAVSGGADSLALLLLSKQHFDVTAITIDHGLRAEAAEEAEWVKTLLSNHGIPHVTLFWDGEKPDSNIQARAREARYELLANWCQTHDIHYVAAAHHMDDQAETLLLRLARGSGVYGLAGMAPTRSLGKDVTLIRPLLSVEKVRLIAALKAIGQSWIEDPSNKSEAYDRVRIRKMLESPPVEGLNASRLAATANRMQRSRRALEHYEQKWLKEAVQFHKEGYAILNVAFLESEPEEIVLRGLAAICRFISFGTYVPRMEKLLRLFEALKIPDFKGHTLYGAAFKPYGVGEVLVIREVAVAESLTEVSREGIWDARFHYEIQGELNGLKIAVLGEEGWQQLKNNMHDEGTLPFKRDIILSLPSVYRGTDLLAVPHLNYFQNQSVRIQMHLRERK